MPLTSSESPKYIYALSRHSNHRLMAQSLGCASNAHQRADISTMRLFPAACPLPWCLAARTQSGGVETSNLRRPPNMPLLSPCRLRWARMRSWGPQRVAFLAGLRARSFVVSSVGENPSLGQQISGATIGLVGTRDFDGVDEVFRSKKGETLAKFSVLVSS